MREVYICDKCGKQFTDYSDCVRHEDSHLYLSIFPNEYQTEEFSTYNEDDLVPNTIVCGYAKPIYGDEFEKVGIEVQMYTYKRVKLNSEATKKVLDSKMEELREEKEYRDRQEKKKNAMIEELHNDGVEVDGKSYWRVEDEYKKHFDHEYIDKEE